MTGSERIAEAVMDSFWECHEAGAFERGVEMLRSFGLSQNVVDFVLNPDSFYFPNQRGDSLVRPSSVSDEKIPIVALEKGHYYTCEAPSLHFAQRNALWLAGYSQVVTDKMDEVFAGMEGRIQTNGGSVGAGSVFRNLATSPAIPGKFIQSKPTLIFNIDNTTRPGDLQSESVALHELVHIAQALARPITSGPSLSVELEAYAVQATLSDSRIVPLNEATAMAMTVDNYRRKWLGENEFETHAEFETAFSYQPQLANLYERIKQNAQNLPS